MLRIRSAHPSDADRLSEIAQKAKAVWGYDPDWLAAWRPQLTFAATDIERMIVRVAESDGAIVGFGAVDRYSDGWELSHLWILPEYMRRGIGQRLVSELCEAARLAGAERLRIESDPQAEPFYLRQGAVRVGDTPAPMPGAPQRTLPILELDLLRPKRNVGAE